MTSTTLDQQLFESQARIQRARRRPSLSAMLAPAPDWDPTPPFRRQAVPEPPPSFVDARARFLAAGAGWFPKAA